MNSTLYTTPLSDLAARLDLYGDPDRGWGAAAPVYELDDLRERVVPLR